MLILHAYSPSNAGDGLLVRLALESLERAVGEFDYRVVASDASGFADDRYVQWGEPSALAHGKLRRIAMVAATAFGSRTIADYAKEADLIVAVGGAYLRGGDRVESFKSWGAHYGQLRLAARYGTKTVYLPQSIGPYDSEYGARTVRKLAQLSAVFVRDDKTFAELEGRANVVRVPDMAIIEWARGYRAPAPLSTAAPIFVARDLPRPRNYYTFLQEVADSRRFEWAVQATGSANNDYPVTSRFSNETPRLLADVLSTDSPRVVVSTRLHGSLSSIIAGFPSIHLTYERKGWSAFKDLGLDDFVMSARDASLTQVLDRVNEITSAPADYWDRISASIPHIEQSRMHVEGELRRALAAGKRERAKK